MLGQVLLGSFMHMWDCLSDCYVVYLWHAAGRLGLFSMGVVFLLLSPVLTGIQGVKLLGRFGYGKGLQVLSAMLTPFNAHNMVFGYLALRDAGAARTDRTAYSKFTYLKGAHAGLQSVPLAVMTGIDLLTGGGHLGLLVKVTSLGLSIFSISFTGVIHSSNMHGHSFQKSFDYFMLGCFDMIWAVLAFGWVVAAFDAVAAGVAIGATFAVVFVMVYTFFWHFFHPCEREFLQAILLPYEELLGRPKSIVDDVLAGERSVWWVLPVICFFCSLVQGAVPVLFDLRFVMPLPGAKRIMDGTTLDTHLAVTRRLGLAALSVAHLVANFSKLRMALTLGTAAVHTYFSFRMWDKLQCFGFFELVQLLATPVLMLLAFLLQTCMSLAALLRRLSAQRATARCNSEAQPPESMRPLEIQLSGQEAEFFDMCDRILDAEFAAADKWRWTWCSWNRSKPGAVGIAKRAEVLLLLRQGAAAFAASCRAGTACDNVDLVTRVLSSNYMVSMTDVSKLDACCTALRMLLDGKTGMMLLGTTQAVSASAATTDDATVELRAVAFRTVADAFVWKEACDTTRAFSLTREATCVNYFCSHSWRDGAYEKAAVLRTFLFLQSSVAVTLISTFMFTITFIPGGFILSNLDPNIPWWAMSLCAAVTGTFFLVWSGVSHVCGWSSFVPWRWCRLTFWLDKCCIDQRTEASKQAGIAHLGDSLERSQCMLVIFSNTYLGRLWCTYELARYCKLIMEQEAAALRGEAVGTPKRLLFLSLSWSKWWNPATWMHPVVLSAEEAEVLANYKCREAKFWKRADQDAVLGLIREEWGSEEAFDEYVHTELPHILLQGKREYYHQIKLVMWNSFVTLFGS